MRELDEVDTVLERVCQIVRDTDGKAVLPMPPIPVRVTSRVFVPRSSAAISAISPLRPTREVTGAGR